VIILLDAPLPMIEFLYICKVNTNSYTIVTTAATTTTTSATTTTTILSSKSTL